MIESTEMIEVKQGPYCGEEDKVRFSPVDESMINYIDIFSFYCNNKTNNVLVICVKEKYDGVKCEGQNIYTCDYVALDFLIPMLMDKPIKTNNSNTVMSDELAYKLATEILLEFKFSQTLSGYTFIKQCG